MKTEKLLENQRRRQRQIMFDYSIYNEENQFDWNGEIDRITYRRLYAEDKNDNGIVWEERVRAEIEFNTEGKVFQVVAYRKDELSSKCLKEYDNEGRLIAEKSIDAQEGNQTDIRFKYDQWGNLIEKVILYANVPTSKYLYTYDHQGRLIQTQKHGKYKYWTTYLYNEDGNIAMRVNIHPNGILGEIETYSYDKNGNNESTIFRESFESFTYYEYDAEGKIIKSASKSHSIESEPDKCDNEISQAWYEEYEYDEKGNIISLIEREGSEIVHRHEWVIKYK